MDTRLDLDKALITIALKLIEMGWWSVVSRIYTIEENIVLICWKVKCGGSQSWRCGDSSSTRKVQGPLDLSPSGFQTLVCLLQRMRNLYLYIFMCSICIFVKIVNLYLGEGEHLVVSDWPCSGTSGCCSSQSCAVGNKVRSVMLSQEVTLTSTST